MAVNISFATNEKEYIINGDENRVIRVNVADVNTMKRYEEATEKIEDLKNVPRTPEGLAELDRQVREQLNYTFGTDICTAAFGDVNLLSPVEGGKMLFEAFLEAFLPQYKKDAESVLGAAKIRLNDKAELYAGQVSARPVLSSKPELTPEQESFLRSLLEHEHS